MEKRNFTEKISNWQDWGKIYQSIPAFSPLVRHILDRENLPPAILQNLTPGTNAVFKVGDYVVKIFAPAESGIDQTLDLKTELFAMRRMNAMGVAAPKLAAHGIVEDKYRFAYMITECIDGIEFTDAVKSMSNAGKLDFGSELREITDKMNTPCEPWGGIDVMNNQCRSFRWNKYPERFKAERLAYIKSHDYGDKVFVHGDLCGDNILLTPQGKLFIIDFADAVLAPAVYEHALVAVELFDLDPALMRGYFGDYDAVEMTEICLSGLLIHDFGGDVVAAHIGNPSGFQCLDDLQAALKNRIEDKIS
jgi:tRNA A-37 threonylcarbamoyl transferase component Bud32